MTTQPPSRRCAKPSSGSALRSPRSAVRIGTAGLATRATRSGGTRSGGSLAGDEEWLGKVPRPRTILAEDRLGRVLRDVDASGVVGCVRAAAVEEGAREADDAPGGHDDRVARVVAEVADQVVGLLVATMLDDVASAGARVGQQVDSAVGFGDVVERDPAREIRRMRVGDEARVLVPPEGHPALGRLDDVLLVEQVDGVPERRLRGVHHEVREQEPLDRGALAVGMDEVAAAAVAEIQLVDAEAGHLPIALVDEALAFAAEGLEIGRRQGGFEDEVALVAETACVRGGDPREDDGHAASPSAGWCLQNLRY